jgi:hypothetical protein
MDPTLLRDHLTRLHEELKSAPRVDAASIQLLGELQEDIKRLTPSAAATSPSGHEGLPDRLEKIAVLFEVDHPTLAASSRRLIDMLGKVGL